MLTPLMPSPPGPSPWPQLPRPQAGGALLDGLLRSPSSAQLVVGPAGVGKTALAEQVLDGLAGREVVRVIGLPELRSVPLGAFAPALAALVVPADPGEALPRLLRRLGHTTVDHVVLVDDAPWLDDVSAGAVYQLVRAFGVPTVMTARLGEALPRPLTRLIDEGLAERHDLPGMTAAEVDQVLETRFGRHVRHADVARITDRTAGNPLYLRVLVESAIRSGGVRIADSLVEIDDGSTPSSLLDSVAERVASLDRSQRRLLHLVAIAQPIARRLVEAAVDSRPAVDRLVDQGLIIEVPGDEPGGPRLRVAHPLFAEAVRDDADRSEVAATAAMCLRASGVDADRLAAVLLLRGTRTPPTASELAWAARRVYATGDLTTSVGIAGEAEAGDLTHAERFATMLTAANAQSTLGRLDDADERFALAERLARAPEELVLLAGHRGEHLAFRRFAVAAAVAQAEIVRDRVPSHVAAPLDAHLRLWRAVLGQAHVGSSDLPAADVHPEAAVRSAMAAIMTESMNGRSDAANDAAALLASVQDRLGVLDPAAAAMLGFGEYIHLLSLGDHEKALEVAQEHRSTAGDGVGIWTSTVAEHRNYNGRLAEARQLSVLAVDQCRWRDVMGVLGLALAVHADVLAKCGEHERAVEVLRALEPDQRAEPKAALLVAECQAWLAQSSSDFDGAEEIVVRAAERAIAVGFRVVAAISLGLCIRIGRVDRAAALLQDICADLPTEFVLYTSLRDLAIALRDRRPGDVPEPAARLARAGMAPTALDAIAIALRLRPSREICRRLERLAATLAVDVDAPLVQRVEVPVLTRREHEIALAAADRERSREISARLGISVRTVDNQLQSVYRKLGVSSRDELREALAEIKTTSDTPSTPAAPTRPSRPR